MKRLTFLLACFLSAGFLNLFGQQTVTDEKQRFSISIPADWVYSTKNSVVSVTICSDTVSPNDRINIIYTKDFYNLEKTYKTNKESVTDYKAYKFIEEGSGTIGGQPSKWILFSFEGSDGVIRKSKQITAIGSGKSFIIQYVMIEKNYESKKEPFEAILSTIKFAKK